MEKPERSIGERWYEIEDRRIGEAIEEAAAEHRAKRKFHDPKVWISEDSDRVLELAKREDGSIARAFRDAGGNWHTKTIVMPDDLVENFWAIEGDEAEKLAREAAEAVA